MNTTLKAFVAKAAAGLMQEMMADAMAKGRIDNEKSWNDNKRTYEHLALQARLAAESLAYELQEGWEGKDNHQTVFFDVQDSPTSRLEAAVCDVSERLSDLNEEVKKIAKQLEA